MKVLVQPKKLLIERGADAVFHCKVHPGAEYTWIKNGSKLVLDQYHVASPLGTLRILGATFNDAAEYVCLAQNEAGISASTGTLAIGGIVGFPHLTFPFNSNAKYVVLC